MSHDSGIETTPDPSVGQLMTQLSEQTSRLVRDELQLAKTELKDTAKHAGLGAGLFGAAGMFALFGVGTLIATVIIVLALVLPLWASALIVAGALLAIAGIAGLVGKQQVQQSSPTPQRTLENVQHDVHHVQEAGHHDHTHQSCPPRTPVNPRSRSRAPPPVRSSPRPRRLTHPAPRNHQTPRRNRSR